MKNVLNKVLNDNKYRIEYVESIKDSKRHVSKDVLNGNKFSQF